MSDAKNLVKKLVAISKAVGFLEYDSKNDHGKYGYTSAAALIQAVNKAATEQGVSIQAQSQELVHYEPGNAVVKVTLGFSDGEAQFSSQGLGEGRTNKAVMIAATGAYKYALAHAFMLSWGALDAENDANEPKKPAARAKRTPKKAASKQLDLDESPLVTIVVATTLEALEKAKPAIRAYRDTDKALYDELREKYTARENELKEGE